MTLLKAVYRNQAVGELPAISLTRKALTVEQVAPFRQLVSDQVKPRPYVRGHQQRMGVNNAANLSRYRALKEYFWPAEAKAALQPLAAVVAREATHWLLYFGEGDFLDEQDAWLERRVPVDFYLVALYPKQQVVIDGHAYTLAPGDAIQFAPSYRHAVPPVKGEAAWLCFMVFRDNPIKTL